MEQVLLGDSRVGDSRVCELENSFPSKAGLQTVFEVLDIQNNFWPSLKPIFMNVMSLWKMHCLGKKSEELSFYYVLKLFYFDIYFTCGRGKFAISPTALQNILCT
jgi:hypothetical protein